MRCLRGVDKSRPVASMAMKAMAMLAFGLAHLISAEFVVPAEVGSPVAYYALDEGTGFELRESISGAAAAGKVIYDTAHQNITYDQPNWVNVRRPPATAVATGVASHRCGPALRESPPTLTVVLTASGRVLWQRDRVRQEGH